MKLLLIHADFIEFKIKEKAIQAAEEFEESPEEDFEFNF